MFSLFPFLSSWSLVGTGPHGMSRHWIFEYTIFASVHKLTLVHLFVCFCWNAQFNNECNYPGDGIEDTPAMKLSIGCPDTVLDSVRSIQLSFVLICPHLLPLPTSQLTNLNSLPQCPTEPGNDPTDNFMSLSTSSCMNHFTPGQQMRMNSQYWKYRA